MENKIDLPNYCCCCFGTPETSQILLTTSKNQNSRYILSANAQVPICNKCQEKYFIKPSSNLWKYGSWMFLILLLLGGCLNVIFSDHLSEGSNLSIFISGGIIGVIIATFIFVGWMILSLYLKPAAIILVENKIYYSFSNKKYDKLFAEMYPSQHYNTYMAQLMKQSREKK